MGIDQNRHDGKRAKHYEVWPKRTNRRTVNPRTLVPAKLKMMPNGTIKVLVSPGAMAKMRVGNPARGNPMRQWDVRVPPTMQLGSYRFGPVRKTMAEAKRAALSEYNDSRRHEGLPTLKSLPRGTTVKEYSR